MTDEIRPGIRRLLRGVTRAQHAARRRRRDSPPPRAAHEPADREGMSPEAAQREAERRFGEIDDERRVGACIRRATGATPRLARLARFPARRPALCVPHAAPRSRLHRRSRSSSWRSASASARRCSVSSMACCCDRCPSAIRRASSGSRNIGDDGTAEWRLQVAHFVDLGARSQSLADIAGLLRLL